jgi:hypothetical protein
MVSMATGKINIQNSATTVYCVLGTVAPTKATWATYNDIKWAGSSPFEIAVVNGYALGGSAMTTTVPTCTTTVTGIKASPTTFTTTGTLACTYAIPQALINTGSPTSVTTTNPLLSYHGLGSQSVTNGTLSLTWNAAGIFTMTVATAA